ncbi:hypothetical protein GLOIN_2v1769762 [Rhizophagus clarus]|uniref:RING-type domain-containing protein n=1 Tax=Rhizophagus clarus TaxID=94130 RepID=A0A8H3QE15_9GLOM|nr:hypothetical protein GLOIN_2v1769762 [Rhizophagus clarus]
MTSTESTKDSSYQIPERPHPSLTNYRNFAYSILKYLEDDMVGDKKIPELESCSECTMNILSLPIKALTILSCGHIFHRSCIEKQLLHTKPSTCPSPDCGKNVDIIVDSSFIRRGLQSSQSSRISAISNVISEKFVLNSPAIPEDPMEGIEDSAIPRNQLLCAKCLEEITADFTKDTVFLSCKHAVHYDCIGNPHKKYSTCSGEDLVMFPVEQASRTTQKKRSNDSTEKSSSKKAKKNGGKIILEKLIEELISEISQDPEIAKEGIPLWDRVAELSLICTM